MVFLLQQDFGPFFFDGAQQMIDDSELGGLRRRIQKNNLDFEIVKPFGPSILETTVPPDAMSRLLELSSSVLETSNRESWGRYLVGQIREESHVPVSVFKEFGVLDYLLQMFAEYSFGCLYCNSTPEYKKEVDKLKRSGDFRNPARVEIESAWIVSQQPGEYNPIHNHSISTMASVMYLKIPDKMQSSSIPGKQNTDGCIEFVDRSVGDSLSNLQVSTVRLLPQAGRFYIFPSSLLHLVYPYQGGGERRSLGINATHKF